MHSHTFPAGVSLLCSLLFQHSPGVCLTLIQKVELYDFLIFYCQKSYLSDKLFPDIILILTIQGTSLKNIF